MRCWIAFLAVVTGCAGSQTRVPAPSAKRPDAEVSVTTEVAGTVLKLGAHRGTACSEHDLAECTNEPLANSKIAIVEQESGNLLATVQTSNDGVATVELASLGERFLDGSDDYEVWLGDRPRGTVSLKAARALLVSARNERDLERYLAEARAAADRNDWQAVARTANQCLRLQRNHTECEQLTTRASTVLREEDESRKTTLADEQQALATAAQRGGRWQEVLDASMRCLESDPERVKCSDLLAKAKPKVAGDAARRAREAVDAGQLAEALEHAITCGKLVPGQSECRAVVKEIDDRYGRAQRVRDFAAYREGGGYLVYFNIVSEEGQVLDLLGQAELSVVALSSGMPVTGWTLGRWPIKQDGYKRVALGAGAFQREAVVASQWIKTATFFDGAPIAAWQAEQFLREYDTVVKLVFTDVFGRKFDAQADFVP